VIFFFQVSRPKFCRGLHSHLPNACYMSSIKQIKIHVYGTRHKSRATGDLGCLSKYGEMQKDKCCWISRVCRLNYRSFLLRTNCYGVGATLTQQFSCRCLFRGLFHFLFSVLPECPSLSLPLLWKHPPFHCHVNVLTSS
jgi:hypothetical protein